MKGFKVYRYKVWIKQAEFDLEAARLSFGNSFFEWTCFQSEQSAEKALKAIMVFCGYRPPKLHKLSILYRIVKQLRPEISNLKMESLQAYTFVSRYPFIIPGDNLTPHEFMTNEHAAECLSEAQAVLSLVHGIIEK